MFCQYVVNYFKLKHFDISNRNNLKQNSKNKRALLKRNYIMLTKVSY